ncbi:MAG: AAA family ATPase, partial [Thermoleophilia bacterium]|nr:AAA family ATPase [Thermoleophilia bacterium]
EAELRAGDDSILLYERWLAERDDALLEAIADYNKEDCRITYELREWLLGLREEAMREYGQEIPWAALPEHKQAPEAGGAPELRERLLAGMSEDPDELSVGERERWLAAHLLDYHRREAKPVWWAFFNRKGATPDELAERDREAIGGLVPAGDPWEVGQSLVVPFSFPAQEHKLSRGDGVHDPVTLASAGSIDALDDARGYLELRRGPTVRERQLPDSLIPGGPLDSDAQQGALRRLAESIERRGGRYPALEAILRRELPRVRGLPAGAPLAQDDLGGARRFARELDSSYLVVQGPPGSGKTYAGARMIVELLAHGRRVGVTSTSHKAIHNLLLEVERVADREGVRFRGLKKGASYSGPFIKTSGNRAAFSQPDHDVLLLAGTAWLFAREEMEDAGIDTLFVDEAGQVSLADALAMGTCARNVVLLGDPQQLAQVSQGTHPKGTDASVLEHLLGDEDTIPADRGLFLGFTWRMHPDVAAFVSETSYEGRLHAAERCARQGTAVGTGIRFVEVAHEANRVSSPEEAARVRKEIDALVGLDYTDCDGVTRPLRYSDFMVVAPYNAQVRCLRAALPEAVPVGTVDKFQGQEAPVVFYSLASSSGEDVPRGLEFLFSRNRLNVAISRAKCLAYVVASPRLLDVRCRTVDQMRLANALCRLVELAGPR